MQQNSTSQSNGVLNGSTSFSSNKITDELLDQSKPPGDLASLPDTALFLTFRPRARIISPEGWMNDPMVMFQRADGSFHSGYQSYPQHIAWGSIRCGAAHSQDMTHWHDFGSPSNYITIAPDTIYDIRGVFDGALLPLGHGYNGNPTILYTSTSTIGPLGSRDGEIPGVETQSIAYTEDEGASWIKLPFGLGGNPVIYNWPMEKLTGFRDPYIIKSPYFLSLLGKESKGASGELFATLSGGVVDKGSKLFLYRQTKAGDVTGWTYLGPLLEYGLKESWSEWSGNFGINFETAFVNRLSLDGNALDDGSDEVTLDIIGFGTEQGRFVDGKEDHGGLWATWAAVDYKLGPDCASVVAETKFAGVADWGLGYAFVSFPVKEARIVMVGWIREDAINLALIKQLGYQGSFTLFRDLFVKQIKNVDPATVGLHDKGSWSVSNSKEGVTVTTLGQRVIPETLKAYKEASILSSPPDGKLPAAGEYQPFKIQPTGRYYAVFGTFNIPRNSTTPVGFRVLASDEEHTDILYDLASEELTVVRSKSSHIKTFLADTERGKLRLWPQLGASTVTLELSVFVDGSVIEIYANHEFALSTRAYPWLAKSVGVGLLSGVGKVSSDEVAVSELELWDGLINAWPDRPTNTSRGLVEDGPVAKMFGFWSGV